MVSVRLKEPSKILERPEREEQMVFIIEDRNLYARASSKSHQSLISNYQSVVLCIHDAGR
jgi:hypothetical protein